MISINDRGGNY